MKLNVTIDDKKVQAKQGQTILEAAQANGIEIPTLCQHKDLEPIGACRICVVEVQGAKGLTASCCTPVGDGMIISTNSEKVKKARRVVINLILSSHAHNCVVCSTANVCELQKLAADCDIGKSRYKNRKRYYQQEDVSPYVFRDLSKCIMCYRCVAACKNIKKVNIYAVSYRGFDSKITVDLDEVINKDECKDCEVCIKVCPVGALLKPEKRFGKKHDTPFYIKG